MSTYARDQHRTMARQAEDAQARDGGDDGQPDIARPRRSLPAPASQPREGLAGGARQRGSGGEGSR